MRNFFLLEAGDTMYDFYTSIFDKIREKETWQNVAFLNVHLQEAVGQRYPEDSARWSVKHALVMFLSHLAVLMYLTCIAKY